MHEDLVLVVWVSAPGNIESRLIPEQLIGQPAAAEDEAAAQVVVGQDKLICLRHASRPPSPRAMDEATMFPRRLPPVHSIR
jgi:hypothetical protein